VLNRDINRGDYFVSKEYFEKKLKRFEVKENDILLTGAGTLGELFVVPPNAPKGIINQALLRIRLNKDVVNQNFFYYYFKYYIKSIISNINGDSVIPNLPPLPIIKSTEIDIPDLPTQQKIAAVLSALDAKIELNTRINAELESMAKTLYDYWFVQFRPPPASPKWDMKTLHNNQISPVPFGGGAEGGGGGLVWNDELKREIPLGWEVGTLSNLGTITGGSTPPREVEEFFSNNGTAWITPKDLSLNAGNKFITKGELDVSEKGLKAASLTIMPKGTILLSSRAPIGYMAIAREGVTTNQGFKSFIPDKGYSIPFIYYTVKNAIPTIINHSTGSTFKEASASVLKSISICLPPVSITEKYKEAVDAIFERQNKLELESQTLTELRDWLLPMLMNGQVKVQT
ncbi:MAG TPA: restriction endonuclease subunit S, partial [Anaerolineales bacterium]|nr:restriction endonuclease subunit S [Anaerolineales bacterium]